MQYVIQREIDRKQFEMQPECVLHTKRLMVQELAQGLLDNLDLRTTRDVFSGNYKLEFVANIASESEFDHIEAIGRIKGRAEVTAKTPYGLEIHE